MDDVRSHDDEAGDQSAPARSRPSRKYPWAILIVIALFVIVPFVSWYGTWFGRPLSDAKMDEYLHDRSKPRKVQHALTQISQRILDRDQSVRRWYPAVLEAASNDSPGVRMTAAWVMGHDNTDQEFHSTLLTLLLDPEPGVRHNAALGLVRFGDSRARPELIAMLKPYTVRAKSSGVLELIAREEGVAVAASAPLARIRQSDGNTVEIHAAEEGRVESILVADGGTIEENGELMTLSPSTEQVWEALRALYLVGQSEDIPDVQRYTRQTGTMPDRVQKQAVYTIEAIRERARETR